MDDDDLLALLAEIRKFGTEATSTEVKASRTEVPKSVRETLSAFANTPGGGTLILGISEKSDFAATGVENVAKIQADLASLTRTEIQPPLQTRISIHEVEGRHLVAAQVPELPKAEKPAYCKSLGMTRGSFVRVGDGERRLTPEEVQQLVADRGQPLFDCEIIVEASNEDLDEAAIEAYVQRLQAANPRLFADESRETILRMTRVLSRGPDGHQQPTMAGILALGRYPQQFFPQLNITFVHYPSRSGEADSQGVRFLDNVSVDGSIPVMVDEVLRTITRNMSRRAMVTGQGRRDMWEYPPEALREAIVNALVHRDLSPGSRGQQVQVEMFPDRLTVKNAGGLYGSVDITRLGETGVSSARNAALMRILEDVPIGRDGRTVCENRGSGIRAMRAALRNAGMGLPVFQDKVTSFEVGLPNHSLLDGDTLEWLTAIGREGLRDSQCTALALLRRGEVFDNAKYRAATGIQDSRAATFELQDLVARELIEQHGDRSGARYTLSQYAQGALHTDGRRRTRPDRRQQILDSLAVHRELSKTDLATNLNINPKTVEHWLRRLKGDGLIEATTATPGDRNTRYVLTDAGLQGTLFDDQD